MKAIFLVTLFFFGKLFMPAHDVPVAIFHIVESAGVLKMDIVFDLEDFSKTLAIKPTEVNLKNVQNYLAENTSFQFNAQVANLKISEVKIVRDHLKVRGDFGKLNDSIKNVKIKNRCLNDVRRHSNVIQIDLNNTSRDFRMHKNRTVIDVAY